ncbi:MAG TPA: TonB-dependent receptor [Gemmatimonadaceae bacterium]
MSRATFIAGMLMVGQAAVGQPAIAQDSTRLRPRTLDTVVVTVTRGIGSSSLDAPFAMTILRPDSTRPGQRHTAFDESLSMVPGLTAVSRTNPSQDPRISIRGFGSRSTFGVRGVRILRDGMPLTLPDGQTPVDYLSLESVGSIEVIRGAASALYGNASGGVINLRTSAPPAARLSGEAHQWFGDYGLSRTTLKGGGVSGPAYYQADASLTSSSGFRVYSRQRSTSVFARAGAALGGTDYAIEFLGFDLPLAENPGSLTLAQFRSNPRSADELSVDKAARKVVRQTQIGLNADRQLSHDELSASAYFGNRSLYNPLTFAVVDVARKAWGGSGRFTHLSPIAAFTNRATAGFDIQSQNDSRLNFVNCRNVPPPPVATASCPVIGAEEGTLTLNQLELVSSAGGYMNDEIRFGEPFVMSAGLRADNVTFRVRDRLIGGGNPDDSGKRILHAVTPYVGVVAHLAPGQSVYANVSSAFETPTATELGNHPDGSAGINPDLKPQRSATYEIGLKGYSGRSGRLGYDVAVFTTRVHDELVPYEIPGSGGRRYFRNAGRTNRRGAELGVNAGAGELRFNAALSYSDFRFDRYVTDSAVFDGRRIPGIPISRAQSSATWTHKSVFAVVEVEAAGATFVDDANTARAPGYEVMHIRGGMDHPLGAARVSLVAGAQNIFNRLYSPSLSVNAARGKFFEPAPRRAVYIGLSVGSGRRESDKRSSQ